MNKLETLKKQVWRKNSTRKSLCHIENRLYSKQDFKLRLAIEKRRAERSSCKSSIILFDLKPLIHGYGKCLTLEDITSLICDKIRVTDIGMLYKRDAILLLLPDTGHNGAECLCQRIIQNMMDYYAARITLAQDDFHIKILSFPERSVESIDVESIIAENADFQSVEMSSSISLHQNISFKREYHDNLSLCESSFNGSTLSVSVDNIFLWDLSLVSSYVFVMKQAIKKVMDIIGALAALILSMPFMLLIAVGVKLSSPGPVLFKQTRVGYWGRPFTFLKFRSMVCENENDIHQKYVKKLISGDTEQLNNGSDDDPCYKMNDDPRTTAFGRFLRKTSLDELPQLFNVLKGEMSLVGPRPPLEYEVKEYRYWHVRRILEVKPGITGLWQVSGRNQLSFAEMVRLDIRYAENWSLMLDLKILLKTLFVVLAADGH